MVYNGDLLPVVVKWVIKQESGGKHDAVSSAGAKGLMQLMDATAKETMVELGMDPETYDPFNPNQNKLIGTAYLKKMIGLFEDFKLALAAYNAGPGRVSKLCRLYGYTYDNICSSLPAETRNYVASISKGLAEDGVII